MLSNGRNRKTPRKEKQLPGHFIFVDTRSGRIVARTAGTKGVVFGGRRYFVFAQTSFNRFSISPPSIGDSPLYFHRQCSRYAKNHPSSSLVRGDTSDGG